MLFPRPLRCATAALSMFMAVLVSVSAPAETDQVPLLTADRLLEEVRFLASPECAGRLPGTPGYDRAAAYAAEVFAGLGLEPGGQDGWYQPLPMECNVIEECAVELIGADGGRDALVPGVDYSCRGFTGSGSVEAKVVFVGYGLSLPERGYDDYAGLDVKGKVVLAFKQAPSWRLPDGEGWDHMDLPRPKAQAARDHGAAALLLVSRPNDPMPQPVIASVLHGNGNHVPDLPAVQVSVAAAAVLCRDGLAGLMDLQAEIDKTRAPASRVLAGSARVEVTARYRPEVQVPNVVAILRGSDPQLKDECLIVGGHLDHVGRQGDVFWPGANDNASGAVGVLGVARAFAAAGTPPRRTVVFVLFAGEEQGLHGANFHADHPVLPLARTVAMFNLDCIAFGDSIQIGGGQSQPDLWRLARDIDAKHARLSVSGTWGGGGADASPFFNAGVPTLYFVSRYSYTYLHQVGDTPETLNPGLFREIVKLVYRTASEVAGGGYQREDVRPEG